MDFKFKNNVLPSRGRILVSDPFEADEFFERSVVYLCEHDDNGSFGFVINKPILVKMQGVGEQFPESTFTAFRGGPCDTNSLFFIHTLGDRIKDSQNLGKGIYLGTNYKELYKIITPDLIEEGAIKIFIGYSGWSAKQLQIEIDKNSWAISDFEDSSEIMLPSNNLWEVFMNKLGKKYQVMSKFPKDPTDN